MLRKAFATLCFGLAVSLALLCWSYIEMNPDSGELPRAGFLLAIVGCAAGGVALAARPRNADADVFAPTHPVITPPPSQSQPADDASSIEHVRWMAGDPPRTFAPAVERYLQIDPPSWLNFMSRDELKLVYRHQKRTRRDGKIIWGCVVQANEESFQLRAGDVPASVIFSEDPFFDDHPHELVEMAEQLYELKGTEPIDPVAKSFAHMLTNEYIRAPNLPVPATISGGRPVFHSSLMLIRKHLPAGVLVGRTFPIWLDPRGTGAILLVPAAFWPAQLLEEWSSAPERGSIQSDS